MERMNVVISTDGACSGNHLPGKHPGGYAAVLRFGEHVKEISGYEEMTTNNRMELKALLEAIKLLKKPCDVTARTDSNYICNGIACAKERSQNGWRTKTGARIQNPDLWIELHEVATKGHHHIRYEKVAAHAGDADNERCDQLAKAAIAMAR